MLACCWLSHQGTQGNYPDEIVIAWTDGHPHPLPPPEGQVCNHFKILHLQNTQHVVDPHLGSV